MAGTRRPTLRAQQLRRDATPAERRLWQVLGARRLGVKFSRQMPVGEYICDFLSRSARLAIEIDGDSHSATADYDARRTRFIEARGIKVIRFTNADVMLNIDGVAAAINAELIGRVHPRPLAQAGGET